ncbi:hypothetical protein T459_19270 [Capsicum annuum]|uniref:Uncharacterized protein n=1 Tax=Capsicum annuum TaxID=4072 RepID=A0A2G2Z185_CAPAN|nr:hypothetical protein T459_19270 [Capsicum annuum]
MLCGDFVGISDECKTKLDLKRLESQLMEVIDGNTSLSYNSELNGSDLSEYIDCLRENLNDVLEHHRESNISYLKKNQFTKQLEIVQKKMKFFRYLYATEINGYVNYEKLEYFLLVFLDVDVSNNVNNGNWLNEVMEKGCSYSSYKMKMLPPQGWYEQGIFSTFLSGNKIPSWFTKLVVRSILKENLFEDYYVQTVGSEGGVEEEDNNDNIRDYDDDDNEEATLAEIEELFGDLGERNETMLQQCVNIDEL